jgi:hypothetical protein
MKTTYRRKRARSRKDKIKWKLILYANSHQVDFSFLKSRRYKLCKRWDETDLRVFYVMDVWKETVNSLET